MCSIIASKNFNKLLELINKNQHRGTFSHSLTVYNTINKNIQSQIKNFGLFNYNSEIVDSFYKFVDSDCLYFIAHVQAPTSGLIQDKERIHPSVLNNTYLYHNGILKTKTIKYLQSILQINDEWDTLLLHKAIDQYGFDILSDIDGSFGCLYITEENIFVFSNELINLFYDYALNISSVNFGNSRKLKTGCVYYLNFISNNFDYYTNFDANKFNPYFIPKE